MKQSENDRSMDRGIRGLCEVYAIEIEIEMDTETEMEKERENSKIEKRFRRILYF